MTSTPAGEQKAGVNAPALETEALRTRLQELSREFERHVARATAAYTKTVEHESQLEGLPVSMLSVLRRARDHAGASAFMLRLEPALYGAVMCHAADRKLRQEMYEAHATRCSDRGPRAGEHDNAPVILELLALRHELAREAGLRDYAELAQKRSALFSCADEAEHVLLTYARMQRARAQPELDELWAFAKTQGVPKGFSRWDLSYYATQQRQHMGWDESALSEYFSLDSVCTGLSRLAAGVFGLQLSPVTGNPGTETERVLVARSELGSVLGEIELVTRGAEPVDVSRVQQADERRFRIGCGLSAELDPAMLCLAPRQYAELCGRFGEHLAELVQAEHSGATTVASVLGRRIAAALSQKLALLPQHVASFARHRQSGARLSQPQCEMVSRAAEIHAQITRLDEIERALFALRVHRDYVPVGKATQLRSHVLDTLSQVRREISVLPPSYWERMPNTAIDIFGPERATHSWEDVWAMAQAEVLLSAMQPQAESAWSAQRVRDLLLAVDVRALKALLSPG